MDAETLYKALGRIASGSKIEVDDGRRITKIEQEGFSVEYPHGRTIITLSPKPPIAAPPPRTVVYDEKKV